MRTILLPLILICLLAQFVCFTESQKAAIIDEDTQFVCKYPNSDIGQRTPWGAVGYWLGVLSLLGVSIGVAYLGWRINESRQQKKETATNESADPDNDRSATRPNALSEQSGMCLLDLNDDCLLELIDRLGFIDRARFCGVNRRLRALEWKAKAIADEQSRPDFGTLGIGVREDASVDAGMGRVGHLTLSSPALIYYNDMWHPPFARPFPRRETTRRELTMDSESVMRLFARAVKCCSFQEVFVGHRNFVDPDLVNDTLQVLRDVKTCELKLSIGEREGKYDGASPLVSIDPLLWAMDNGGLRFLHVYCARNWATVDQLLVLIQKIGECSIAFDFSYFDLATGQKIALQLMGIDPVVFDDPPDDLNEIRTTKKGIELYVSRVRDEIHTFYVKQAGAFTELFRLLPGESEGCSILNGYHGYYDRNHYDVTDAFMVRVRAHE